MREDWAEKLKQKLEGHSKTPPAGLWEGISKQMEASSAPMQVGRSNWRWYAAAAAVALLLVGIFVFQEKENQPPLQAENTSLEPTTQQTEIIDSVKGDEEPVPDPMPKKGKLMALQNPQPTTSVDIESPTETETATLHAEPMTEPDEAVAQVAPESEPAPTKDPQPHKKQRVQVLPDEWALAQASSASSKEWAVSVNASGGLLGANPRDGFYLDDNKVSYDPDDQDELNMNLTRATRSKYPSGIYNPKYHLPIRVGVNLNYSLTSHLDLFSGINYTYLHTTYDIYNIYDKPNEFYEQRLHYLGVPLGLSWRLWSNRNFRFYVTGKALIEKCLNEKPWQFSAGGSLGAEYNITRQVGFYVEPSLGYYFKDGTSLEHYYKENPLIFSLEFGLRLHMGK